MHGRYICAYTHICITTFAVSVYIYILLYYIAYTHIHHIWIHRQTHVLLSSTIHKYTSSSSALPNGRETRSQYKKRWRKNEKKLSAKDDSFIKMPRMSFCSFTCNSTKVISMLIKLLDLICVCCIAFWFAHNSTKMCRCLKGMFYIWSNGKSFLQCELNRWSC